jgi:hypothetical protein
MKTIDITPTWSEWGNVYRRFAESGETQAIKALAADLKRVFAMTEGFVEIEDSLTDEQSALFDQAYEKAMKTQF